VDYPGLLMIIIILFSQMLEISNDREKDLLHHIADLQSKIAVLADELQALKLKNVVVS